MWETHIPICGVREAKKGFECRCSVTEVNALISNFRMAGSHFHIFPPLGKLFWVLWFFLVQWENACINRKTCPVLHIALVLHTHLCRFVLIYKALGRICSSLNPHSHSWHQKRVCRAAACGRTFFVKISGPSGRLNCHISMRSQWNVQTIILCVLGREKELLGFWKKEWKVWWLFQFLLTDLLINVY